MNKSRFLAFAAALLAPATALACNPTAMLEGGGGSVNYASALNGSSQCFVFNGLVDSAGANAFPAVAALADATANPTDALFGSLNFGYNGTTWDRLRTVGTGILKTDLSTVAGTATVTGGVAGLQAIAGPVASAGANADNPVKIGGVFNTTQPTVTNGQVVDSQYSARGAAFVATGVDTFHVTTDVGSAVKIDQATPGTTNAVQSIPGTTGGLSTCYVAAAASSNATNCKSAAGQVYVSRAFNTTTTLYYLRMYNLASAPTCSSSTGFVESIPIPANATGAGFIIPQPTGQAFSTGIGFCITAGAANTDNTSAAVGVFVTVLYK